VTDLIRQSVFGEVAALLVLAAAIGLFGAFLRQPLIVSFIVVGLIAGPFGLGIVRSGENIDLLSKLGIAVLLFLVGIKLDVQLIRTLGAVSLTAGLGQVLLTAGIGLMVGLALGLGAVESSYIAVALTFSSTIIVVKLLSDRREIEALHGQVALGILIVQDLIVVAVMIVLSAVGIGAPGNASSGRVALAIVSGLSLVAVVALFARYVAGPLTERLAHVPELLITFAIAQAAMFAALADYVGLGKELGGLLAGISLASTRYRDIMAARLAPLRDFLLLFFFVALGSKLELSQLGASILPAAVFSGLVLIGKPVIVLAIMGGMGFRKRTGFLAGLTLAQISEFSLILMAMAAALGHVGGEVLGLVTLVGLITIAASTYMTTYSHAIYALCEPLLARFERRGTPREPRDEALFRGRHYDVIVLGLGRLGNAVGARLHERGCRVLGVDFNPSAVRAWRKLGRDAEYGDATDPEFIANLPLTADWAVATMPVYVTGLTHEDPRRAIIQALRAGGFRGRIAVTSSRTETSAALRAAGADLVLEPFEDAADRAVELFTAPAAEVPPRA
jgi:Kef-type K+ transport system membrane component KefB